MRHILIIDSNISFSVSIKRAMEATNLYKVRTVTRLSPALEALNNAAFDLIVVDVHIAFATIEEVIPALQAQAPRLPIIISSPNDEDRHLVHSLKAQGFIIKPFVARLLMPIVEETLARGLAPDTAPHQLAQALEEQEKQQVLEPMLEATRRTAATMMNEPPRTADDSTISEILDQALRPEVSQRIYASLDPAGQESQPQPVAPPPADTPTEGSNAAHEALSVTQDVASLDNLLEQIRLFASGQASGRANQVNPFLDPLGTTHMRLKRYEDSDSPSPAELALRPLFDGLIDPHPSGEETYPARIPRPMRLPDQEWFDMADEPTAQLPNAPARYEREVEPETLIGLPPEVILMPTTLDQITEQLQAVEVEVIEEQVAQEAQALRLSDRAVAHYAAQLTRFALESSAKGIMITRGLLRLAQAGDLDMPTWDQLTALVIENWAQEGDSRTRVLYRRLEVGEILIYSIQTIHDLTLTLVFLAEMPLKMIRRQAAQLSEALLSQPLPSEEDLYTEPMPAVILPTQDDQDTTPNEALPLEGQAEAPAPVIRIQRAPGTYSSYACVWLVEEARNAINPTAARMIEGWIREICQQQDWDFEMARIEREWLYVVVGVPVGTLPSAIAQTLMEGTAQRALALDPRKSADNPWGQGYLIRTPPDSVQDQHVQRFMQFYRSTRVTA
jgi:DNA-binding NarL/FixJ family response regulator